jgi:hypothetical protein
MKGNKREKYKRKYEGKKNQRNSCKKIKRSKK